MIRSLASIAALPSLAVATLGLAVAGFSAAADAPAKAQQPPPIERAPADGTAKTAAPPPPTGSSAAATSSRPAAAAIATRP